MLPAAPKRAARETPPRLRAAKVFPWIWPTPRVPPDQRLMWLAPCGPTRRPEIERLAWKFAPEKVRALRDIPGAEKCMAPPPKRAPPPPKRAPPPLKCPPPPPKWPPPPPKWPPPPPPPRPPAAALNGSASAMIPATARVLIFDMTKPLVPLCVARAPKQLPSSLPSRHPAEPYRPSAARNCDRSKFVGRNCGRFMVPATEVGWCGASCHRGAPRRYKTKPAGSSSRPVAPHRSARIKSSVETLRAEETRTAVADHAAIRIDRRGSAVGDRTADDGTSGDATDDASADRAAVAAGIGGRRGGGRGERNDGSRSKSSESLGHSMSLCGRAAGAERGFAEDRTVRVSPSRGKQPGHFVGSLLPPFRLYSGAVAGRCLLKEADAAAHCSARYCPAQKKVPGIAARHPLHSTDDAPRVSGTRCASASRKGSRTASASSRRRTHSTAHRHNSMAPRARRR